MGEDVTISTLGVVFLAVSNLAIVPSIILAFYYKLFPEATILTVVGVVSTVYHSCQAGGCLLTNTALQSSDHFFVFSLLVWMTLYFLRLDLDDRVILSMLLQMLLLPSIIDFLHSWWVAGAVFIFLSLFAVIALLYARKKVMDLGVVDFLVAIILLGGGFFFHIYAGEPGGPKYNWAHSVWHVTAMLAIFFLLKAMNDRKSFVYRLLKIVRKKKSKKRHSSHKTRASVSTLFT